MLEHRRALLAAAIIVAGAGAAFAQGVGLGLGVHEVRHLKVTPLTACTTGLVFDHSDATGCNFIAKVLAFP